jgi:hypothetical protein
MDDFDWAEVHRLRRTICRLEETLDGHYRRRVELIVAMSTTMHQRELGSYWRISQPRIAQILKAAQGTVG